MCSLPEVLDDWDLFVVHLRYMFDFHRSCKELKQGKIRHFVDPEFRFVIKKGPLHGALHGNTEAQREYFQALQCSKKAQKKNYDTILRRFQQSETHRIPLAAIGWNEELCER